MKGMGHKSNGQINLIDKLGKTNKMPPDAKYGMGKPHSKACSDAKSGAGYQKGSTKSY